MALIPGFPLCPSTPFFENSSLFTAYPYIYGMLTSVVYGSIYSKEAAVFEKGVEGAQREKQELEPLIENENIPYKSMSFETLR